MDFRRKYGEWAIVAGSAEGLGRSFSLGLARKKINLVMVDHDDESLNVLSSLIERDFRVKTIPVHSDLGEEGSVLRILDVIADLDCRLLVYTAAFSRVKTFLEQSDDELDRYINVNVKAPLKLIHGFALRLVDRRKRGGILLMSSLAGLIGMQLVAPYAATKAFTWNLAEALHHEFRPHEIDITACIAGATATPAYLATNPRYGYIKPSVMAPDRVAASALDKLGKKNLFITGFSNRLNYFLLTRLLPRRIAARLANRTMKRMYSHFLHDGSVSSSHDIP